METLFAEDPDGMRHSLLLFARRDRKSIKEYGNLPEFRKSGGETGCNPSSSVAPPDFSQDSLIYLGIYPSVGFGTPLEGKFAFRKNPGFPGKTTARTRGGRQECRKKPHAGKEDFHGGTSSRTGRRERGAARSPNERRVLRFVT
jgi:hypothetical protein